MRKHGSCPQKPEIITSGNTTKTKIRINIKRDCVKITMLSSVKSSIEETS
eukprot:m.190331 g.190331  ORF g.190331 m.190331 type:complete len:50 (-) comp15640_c0_seq5:622-771(-)